MNKKLIGLILVVGLMLPVAARAGGLPSPAWEFSSIVGANNGGPEYGEDFGEVFKPTQTITVDYLGYFYDSSTGMVDSHPVAIYDASGALLASTTITSASLPDTADHFLFEYITPITLIVGDTYVIDSASGMRDNWTWNDSGFTVNAPITLLGGYWLANLNGTSDAFTGTSANGSVLNDDTLNGFWGADFGYEGPPPTTPEPSSFLLLGSGLAGLAGLIKRKLMA